MVRSTELTYMLSIESLSSTSLLLSPMRKIFSEPGMLISTTQSYLSNTSNTANIPFTSLSFVLVLDYLCAQSLSNRDRFCG